MIALSPSVNTTESSAVKSTDTVVSGWIAMCFTLPTSTPAIRTNWPSSSPLTLVNSARYVCSSWKRSWAKTANSANIPIRHTTVKMASRQATGPKCALTVVTSCLRSSSLGSGDQGGGGDGGRGSGGSAPGGRWFGSGGGDVDGTPGGRPGHSGVPSGAYIGAP